MHAFEEHLSEVDVLFKKGIRVYDTPKEKSFIRDTYTIENYLS